jgi:hypothetical protein
MVAPIPYAAILATLRRTLLMLKEPRRALQIQQEIFSSLPILPTEISSAKFFRRRLNPEGRNRDTLVTAGTKRYSTEFLGRPRPGSCRRWAAVRASSTRSWNETLHWPVGAKMTRSRSCSWRHSPQTLDNLRCVRDASTESRRAVTDLCH